jgi:hypothetical protein
MKLKKINKRFKTKYIAIKRIRTNYDIKIKYERINFKKNNLINNSTLNTLQSK